MPEVRFTIRWPDGTEETCYSPSTAIHQHLSAGASYPLLEFLDRARAGLQAASDRVEAEFGYRCSSALDQLAQIEMQAALQPQSGHVACLAIR
jgi:uncharacterized repeat protein (TIGR04042 family)